MRFWKCFRFLAVTGVIGFLLGRLIPKKWINPEKGIFCCFAFEKEGKIYEKLGIRKWQKKVPDMSRIFPFLMPAKNLKGDYQRRLPTMLRETCISELVHELLCLTGLYCLWIWPGIGGVISCLLYILIFNVPFILIQRYNRPRLMKLYKKLLDKEACGNGRGQTV